MKINALPTFANVLTIGAILATNVLTRAAAAEPERIYDLQSGNFIPNPDFHEPATRAPSAAPVKKFSEPRRVYDLQKNQFVLNPDYREPKAPATAASSVRPVGEPWRIYDLGKENFVTNPDYQDPEMHPPVTHVVKATTQHRPSAHHKTIAVRHSKPVLNTNSHRLPS